MGISPGGGQLSPIPQLSDYVARVVGTGIGLVNSSTGNTDYSAASGDHAAVIQQALTNLLANGGPSAGGGGSVAIKGQPVFSSQLVLHPNVSLVGADPIGYDVSGTFYCPAISSTYNGSCILAPGTASTGPPTAASLSTRAAT